MRFAVSTQNLKTVRAKTVHVPFYFLRTIYALLLLLPTLSFAEHSIQAESSREYLYDASKALSITDVLHSDNWQPQKDVKSLGIRPGSMWFKFLLQPSDAGAYFTIPNAWITHLKIYFVAEGKVVGQGLSGSHVAYSDRSVPGTNYAFQIPEGKHIATHAYLHADIFSPYLIPVKIKSQAAFIQDAQTLGLLNGIFYGIILVGILANILLYFGTRNFAHILYVGYATALSIELLSIDGLGLRYFWGEAPGLQSLIANSMMGIILTMDCLLAFSLLSLKKRLPAFHKILFVIALGALAFGPAGALWPTYIYPAYSPFILIGLGTIIAAAVMRVYQGSISARLYLLAHGVFITGVVIFVALQLGYLTDSELSRHALHIAAILELILLATAVGYKMRRDLRRASSVEMRSTELAKRVQTLQTQGQIAQGHRQLQRALQGAQRLKTIGQMSGGFAHEFNNILASILGFTELAKDRAKGGKDPRMQEYLHEIEQSGIRGSKLVKQLLIYSRGGRTEPENVHLFREIENTCKMLSASFPADIHFNIQCSIPEVQTCIDPNQLSQLIINLSLNAMESMQRLESTAKADTRQLNIDVSLNKHNISDARCTSCMSIFSGDYLSIEIADHGPGISGNPAELFTPFHTSKLTGHGTGLGLSVVHGIVHEYGGHVCVSNTSPQGARFCIYLPESLPLQNTTHSSVKNILVIDDDAAVARFLYSLLSEHNYRVVIAQDPTQALKRFIHNPDEFDLVITDQLMPHLTGLELAQDFLALRPELPVILCSANVVALDPQQMSASGIQSVFTKPIDVDLLLARIKKLIG